MDDNKNKPMGWPILYTLATLAGVAVLAILKACGIISMSWPVVIAGLVWVPTALLLITLWAAALLIWIGRTGKKIREYNRRRKISRTLDESMKGLTLNGVGPIYGIKRNKGENNAEYEKRIREKLGFSPIRQSRSAAISGSSEITASCAEIVQTKPIVLSCSTGPSLRSFSWIRRTAPVVFRNQDAAPEVSEPNATTQTGKKSK